MTSPLDALKYGKSYLAGLPPLLAPWFGPFKELGWINSDWSPTIDGVASVVVALYLLYLSGRGVFERDRRLFGSSFKWAVTLTALLALFCYLMKHYLIYLFDPDWLFLGNIPWAVAYVAMFVALLHALLSGLFYRKF
ncbi:hypothetical protein [Mesorhizobium sp.]|uniref:hypothetical protein n=1 Tax=Mesorhizobium sp. TaxID=1871066 RepID=UPI000FE771CE|nr:hypothetical protein [Mesorhizobium sp.]RWP23095.1 MAG: hypothetical protein EOR02_32980 [Mesorhizobium sp.]